MPVTKKSKKQKPTKRKVTPPKKTKSKQTKRKNRKRLTAYERSQLWDKIKAYASSAGSRAATGAVTAIKTYRENSKISASKRKDEDNEAIKFALEYGLYMDKNVRGRFWLSDTEKIDVDLSNPKSVMAARQILAARAKHFNTGRPTAGSGGGTPQVIVINTGSTPVSTADLAKYVPQYRRGTRGVWDYRPK